MGAMHQSLLMSKDLGPLTLTALFTTTSATNSHVISSSAQAGDIAVLHCTAIIPLSGGSWAGSVGGFTTVVDTQSGTGLLDVRNVVAYKVLVSGDIGATLSNTPNGGGSAVGASGIAYFRPSKPISTVTDIGTGGAQFTNSAPTSQTIDVTTDNDPTYILFATYHSQNNVTRTSSGGGTFSEIAIKNETNWRAYSRYLINNVGDTLFNITVSMTDGGNDNMMQSLALRIK